MKKNIILFSALSLLFVGCNLNPDTVMAREPGNSGTTIISLNAGTFCYSVYARGEKSDMTTYIEITAVESENQCKESLQSVLITGTILKISETLENNDQSLDQETLNRVSSTTAMKLNEGSADGSTNQWPLRLMKTGTVKFFNDAKGKKIYVGNLPYSSDESYLVLPPEIQQFVNEAKPQSPRDRSTIILIIQGVQEGKKGLNAVNVKKA